MDDFVVCYIFIKPGCFPSGTFSIPASDYNDQKSALSL